MTASELHRDAIKTSRLVANPGCYPTSAILGLAPAVAEEIITQDIIVDSKSGVSGGGRSLTLTNHFSEVNENVFAYALNGHRHLPEIIQELVPIAKDPLNLTFLTHLIPMTRGILSSCYTNLSNPDKWSGDKGSQEIMELYQDYYSSDPFVQVVPVPPQTKQTLGNNMCLVHPSIDQRTGRLIIISCLDNLVKGAAGQAVQNMNVMYGFPEETSLAALAVYP